jgi:tripartite-type tricarboxylate transporter receptor subunit TctC
VTTPSARAPRRRFRRWPITRSLKGYDMNVWFGLFGPAKMPAPMTARLNKELNEILREQDVWQKLQKAGITNDGGTPQALSAFIKAETQRVRAVVNKAVASGSVS